MRNFIEEYGETVGDIIGAAVIIGIIVAALYQGGFFELIIETITISSC